MSLNSHTSVGAAQTVPYKVNFQGRLTNTAGNVMADGLYNVKFRLYSVSTGGTAVWTETRETTNRIQVTNGLFSVQLGDVTALSPSVFTVQPLYFEVELPTLATATCSTAACAVFDGTEVMTPRQPLGASPYAMNADTLDGVDMPSFARRDEANTFTGSQLFKNTTDSTTAFQVQNAAGQSVLGIDTAGGLVLLGTSGAGGLDGKLLVRNASNTNTITIATGITAASYSLTLPTTAPGVGQCLKTDATVATQLTFASCGGPSSGIKRIILHPEFPGATFTGDGTSNSGAMSSDFVRGLTSAQGYKHNYYQWETGQATAQDQGIYVQYQLPTGFSNFEAGSFRLWTYSDSLTSTDVTVQMIDAANNNCYASPVSVKPSAAATWENKTLTDPGELCTFAANDTVTFLITPTAIAPTSNKVKIGELRFEYTGS